MMIGHTLHIDVQTQVTLHGFTKVQQQHMKYTHSLMSFQILYLKHFCVAHLSVCHQSKGSLSFLLEGPSSEPFQAAFVTPLLPTSYLCDHLEITSHHNDPIIVAMNSTRQWHAVANRTIS